MVSKITKENLIKTFPKSYPFPKTLEIILAKKLENPDVVKKIMSAVSAKSPFSYEEIEPVADAITELAKLFTSSETKSSLLLQVPAFSHDKFALIYKALVYYLNENSEGSEYVYKCETIENSQPYCIIQSVFVKSGVTRFHIITYQAGRTTRNRASVNLSRGPITFNYYKFARIEGVNKLLKEKFP